MLPPFFTPEFIRQLELLNIRARKSFLGLRQGGYISQRKGHGLEFSDYRKYEPGDNPRDIDWSAYARTERLFIKRFQEEQDLSVCIIVDTTASMLSPGNERKWDSCMELALSLAYIALIKQNHVKISLPGHLETPSMPGAKSIYYLAEELLKARPGGRIQLLEGVRKTASALRFPGVAVFISDFLMPFEETEAILNALLARNLDLTALQILGSADTAPLPDADSALAIDSETGEELEVSMGASDREDYSTLLAGHCRLVREFCAQKKIAFASLDPTKAVSDFVTRDLSSIGLLK